MSKRVLTTESGAPVADNQNSATAGVGGPILLQDQHLLEKLARFNRERIPERVVHARGSGAYGHFEVTDDVTGFTHADFLSEIGKRTEVFLRFSTVADNLGGADAVRDPRGFAVKFYTEEGNYDLVGNNTPVFFIKDPLKFPDFIHSQKRDPFTGKQEPDNVWDFWAHAPEATHQITWLMGDRGIPASYRHMNGYGSHTYQWTNAKGEAFFVKYHFKTNQGIRSLSSEQAAEIAGKDPNSHQTDLLQAIERGVNPSWTLHVQIMPASEAADYRFNPFDLTGRSRTRRSSACAREKAVQGRLSFRGVRGAGYGEPRGPGHGVLVGPAGSEAGPGTTKGRPTPLGWAAPVGVVRVRPSAAGSPWARGPAPSPAPRTPSPH
ncbi:hypothetical protein SALBM135S_07661 [Streptomyces alboniger]